MTENGPAVFCAFTARGAFIAFWRESDGRLGIFNPSDPLDQTFLVVPNGRFRANNPVQVIHTDCEEEVSAFACRHASWHEDPINRASIRKSKLTPGQFHHRIWRGVSDENNVKTYNAE